MYQTINLQGKIEDHMKALFKIIQIIIMFSVCLSASLNAATINVYPGQENTLYNIAQTAKAGDTVIFHDGTYIERKQVRITKGGGTEGNPIVFKSANPQGAKIIFDMGGSWGRVYVTVPYIHFEGFEITQPKRPAPTAKDPNPSWNHILTFYPGADHCRVINNVIHNGYEEGVKTHKVYDIIIENNYIYDFTHEGIDCTPAYDSVIRNNHLHNNGRCHIMLKHTNPTNTLIYNNYIHNDTVQMANGFGITIGGTMDPDIRGATSCIAFNNIIVSESPGFITKGLSSMSTTNCGFFNNTVIGTKFGMYTNGFNENLTFKNNIFYNIQVAATDFKGTRSGLSTDYNLYYNTPRPPTEPHGVYGRNPQFINAMNDWNLADRESPPVNAGTQWTFKTLKGKVITVAFDFKDNKRTVLWDIGAHEFQLPRTIARPLNLNIVSP